MTTVVVAATVTRAEQVAKQAGITRPVTMSPYSMRHYGAGRGIVADLVLVDDSALPLDDQTLETIALMRAFSTPGRVTRTPGPSRHPMA